MTFEEKTRVPRDHAVRRRLLRATTCLQDPRIAHSLIETDPRIFLSSPAVYEV